MLFIPLCVHDKYYNLNTVNHLQLSRSILLSLPNDIQQVAPNKTTVSNIQHEL
jgi:hypothetical protein